VKDKRTAWTGVRNHTAAKNLKSMKKGDKAFFYHSGEGKEIVGIVDVAKEAYTDPTDKTGVFVAVDVQALKPLKNPVSLKAVKADALLKNMALAKLSRLSVLPVTAKEWERLLELAS
ncbi:MAG TPA: EVE domain-containing protein, partial [Alphaproteobacteria bacterium]|nr:EVE domain-containing protein [Alphaproteobacteria bacterium]